MQKGFDHDQPAIRFYTALVVSAIDEARLEPQQDPNRLTPAQFNARNFLLSSEYRKTLTVIVEAIGVEIAWFSKYILHRLVQDGWPPATETARHHNKFFHNFHVYLKELV